MKKLFYHQILLFFCCYALNAQITQPSTVDVVTLPSTVNSTACTYTNNLFNPPANYNPVASAPQLGVNNTGTDSCLNFTGGSPFQAKVWDRVTALSPFTSTIYLTCSFNGVEIFQQTFSGGFDPDVAISSDSSGTYIQVVFENNTSNKIDGYVYKYNGSTFVPYYFSTTFSNNPAKKAKNPNIATPKYGNGGVAVVWHEEGLVTPAVQLNVTYSTTPPTTYTYNASLLESKVYIYAFEKEGFFEGGTIAFTSPGTNYPGYQVIRPTQANHLFERDYNPDVSFSEVPILNNSPITRGISVVFLSQWFDPSTFSTVSGDLTVVQGYFENFRNATPSTTAMNFTTAYSGKPRIDARLPYTGVNVSRDFSVVMGNSTTTQPCNQAATTTSKLHNWYFQTGGAVPCPVGGNELLASTSFASKVTVDPVISCISGKGLYNITFSSQNAANASSGMDILSKTYQMGVAPTTYTNQFNLINRSACTTANYTGNQVIPSVTSILKSSLLGTNSNADVNYLFWDQNSKTLNYKKVFNNIITGTGVSSRQIAETNLATEFIVYPNPSEKEVTFNFTLKDKELPLDIEVFNMAGQSVALYKLNEKDQKFTSDISGLESGTYFAILKSNVGEYSLQFIKK